MGYNPSFTTQQLVDLWSTPFNNTLWGALPGGFDAIEIDEIIPYANGTVESNRIVAALAQLRAEYPDKIIAAFSPQALGWDPATYSNLLNGINNYADLYLFEAYMDKAEAPGNVLWHANMATLIDNQTPGLIDKTIFALLSYQGAYPGDTTTDVGFWGFLDAQMHAIRNHSVASRMPGVGSYTYPLGLTSEFMGRAMDHYYVQGNTDYFGDGDMTQAVSNPQFENSTAGWELAAGAGGWIGIFNYNSEPVSNTHGLSWNIASATCCSHGSYGLKTVRGSSANEASYDITLEAGKSYNVSAFVAGGASLDVLDAKLKITTETGLVSAEVSGREIVEPSSWLLPWRRLTFNFDVLPGQDHVRVVLSDEDTSLGTTLYWDYIQLEDAYTIGPIIPQWQHAQVFLSPSDTTPIVANPQINLGLGQTTTLYAWVIPDDDGIVSIGLDFESTDLGIIQANVHEVYNPYFSSADRSRWDLTGGGQLGELIFNSSAIVFQDGTGLSQGLGAAGAPLYDAATGAFLHSRIEIQANREGQRKILIKVGEAQIRWSLTAEILGTVQFGAADVNVLASTVGATGSVADAFINVHSGTNGDIDGSGTVDGLDIDKLRNDIALQTTDPSQDLNADNVVDGHDVTYLLIDILQTSVSDVNLDRKVDALDLGIVRNNMGSSVPSGFAPWSQRNIVGNGEIDEFDLLSLRFYFGYVSPAGPAESISAPVESTLSPGEPIQSKHLDHGWGLPLQWSAGTVVAAVPYQLPVDAGVVFPEPDLQQPNLLYQPSVNSNDIHHRGVRAVTAAAYRDLVDSVIGTQAADSATRTLVHPPVSRIGAADLPE